MATGLFKIALVFVSIMVATMELSDARPNIEPSGVFRIQRWDELLGQQLQPEQADEQNLEVSADFQNKKISRSRRWGVVGGCRAKYGANRFNIHMSQDAWCGCLNPPCKHHTMIGGTGK